MHSLVIGNKEESLTDIGCTCNRAPRLCRRRRLIELVITQFLQNAQQYLATLVKILPNLNWIRIPIRFASHRAAEPEQLVPTVWLMVNLGAKFRCKEIIGKSKVTGDPQCMVCSRMGLFQPVFPRLKIIQQGRC